MGKEDNFVSLNLKIMNFLLHYNVSWSTLHGCCQWIAVSIYLVDVKAHCGSFIIFSLPGYFI